MAIPGGSGPYPATHRWRLCNMSTNGATFTGQLASVWHGPSSFLPKRSTRQTLPPLLSDCNQGSGIYPCVRLERCRFLFPRWKSWAAQDRPLCHTLALLSGFELGRRALRPAQGLTAQAAAPKTSPMTGRASYAR